MPEVARIEYQDKAFWIPEGFIEVLSQYICETFENIGISSFSPNLKKIYLECIGNRSGEYIGMVGISLEFITNASEKVEFINVIEQTKALIYSKGTELSIDLLNQFENSKSHPDFIKPWYYPIKTQSLVTTLDFMKQMLEGVWESTNYGVYYVGFPNPGNREEI